MSEGSIGDSDGTAGTTATSGEDTYEMLTSRFHGWRITPPLIAPHVVPYLVGTDVGCVSTLGASIHCGHGYMLGGRVPADYLVDGGPDYFVASGRDNGYSSMWGFASRAGGIFVSVQTTIGNWQHDPRDSASRVFESFNEHLAPLMERGTRPVTVGVLFSTFRHQCCAFSKGRDDDDPARRRHPLDREWSIAVAHNHDGALAVGSLQPRRGDSIELKGALAFLQAVTAKT